STIRNPQSPGIEVRPMLLVGLLALSSVLVIAQSSTPSDSAGGSDCRRSVICPGEELVYEVSWMSVPLGQIRVKTGESKIVDGHIQHSATGYVESYDGLPFVDVHAIDHTYMDDSL